MKLVFFVRRLFTRKLQLTDHFRAQGFNYFVQNPVDIRSVPTGDFRSIKVQWKVVLLGGLLFLVCPMTARGWTVDNIRSITNGSFRSIKTDSANQPNIAYQEKNGSFFQVKFTRFDGSAWTTADVLANSPLSNESLALDSSDNPRLAFGVSGQVVYREMSSDVWGSTRTVDTVNSSFVSLALTSFDSPRVAYYNSTLLTLKYAEWTGLNWSTKTVDSGGDIGSYVSMALDSFDRPRMAYYDKVNNNLKYAEWTGTSWSTQTVDSDGDVGSKCSLALTSSGQPWISYMSAAKGVKVAYWSGSVWITENIDINGFNPVIAVGAGDTPTVVYGAGFLNQTIWSAAKQGDLWKKTIVIKDDSVGFIDGLSVATDKSGLLHASYGSKFLTHAQQVLLRPPTDLIGSVKSSSTVVWTWVEKSDFEEGHRVMRSSDGFNLSGDLPPDTTSWVQTGIPPNTKVQSYVESFKNSETMKSSNSSKMTTWASIPDGLAFTAVFTTSATLSWNANGNPPGITYYDTFKSTDNVNFSQLYSGLTSSSAVVRGLIPEATTYFRVRAENQIFVATSFSPSISVRTIASPSAPTVLTRTTNSLNWQWVDNSSIETGFRVLSVTDNVNLSGDLPANTTNWFQADLGVNTPQNIIVQAFNDVGVSNSPASGKTYTLANPPTDTVFTGIFVTSVTLSWSANGNPSETTYDASISTDNISFTQFYSRGTGTSVSKKGLTPGATYYFQVRAVNGNLLATTYDSVVPVFIIPLPPLSSGNPFVSARTPSTIIWSWADLSNNEEGFRVLRDSDSAVLATLPANTTSWVQNGLGPNNLSRIQVEAFNLGGSSKTNRNYAQSEEYSAANSPQTTTITKVTPWSVSLSWELNGNTPETHFTGLISTDNVSFSVFGDFIDATSMTANNLLSGVTYYFKIAAKNSGNELSPDGVVSTPIPFGPPGMPFPLVNAKTKHSLTWGWPNQANAKGYRILNENGTQVLATLPSGTTSWIQSGLGLHARSAIQVEAFNDYGSNRSARLYGQGQEFTEPNPPSNFIFTRVRPRSIALTWSNNENPPDVDYVIERSTTPFPDNTDFIDSSYAEGGATSKDIQGLSPGTTYFLRAHSAGNSKEFSAVITTVTPVGIGAPLVNAVNPDSIVWNWTDDVDGETGYRVLRYSDGEDLSGLLSAGVLSWTQGMVPNTPSQVFVRVEGGFGNQDSGPSEQIHSLPNVPLDIHQTGKSFDKISLAWNSNGNPPGTNYKIFEVSDGESATLVAQGVNLTATIGGLRSRTSYTFFVRATGPAGESTPGTKISVTTAADLFSFDLANPAWSIETVDAEGFQGKYASIALDSTGIPHIFYSSGEDPADLKQAIRSAPGWTHEVIVPQASVGAPISAAFDTSGNAHLTFHNTIEDTLKYLSWNGIGWVSETLPSDSVPFPGETVSFSGQGFQGSSLRLTPEGKPWVVYTSSYLPPVSGAQCSYFFYEAEGFESGWGGRLIASTLNPATTQGKSSAGMGHIALALDSKGQSHVAYFHVEDQRDVTNAVGTIYYARRVGDLWTSEIIEEGVAGEASDLSIEIDPHDQPHVAYSTEADRKVQYAVKGTGGWTIETVDHGNLFSFVHLALDPGALPVVTYTDVDNGNLRFARRVAGGWQVQTVDSGEGKTGWYSSLAVDLEGNVHVAYQDNTNQDLKYASILFRSNQTHGVVHKEGGRLEFTGSRGPVIINIVPGTFTEDIDVTLRSPDMLPVVSTSKYRLTPLGVGLEIVASPSAKPLHPILVTLSFNEDDLIGQSANRLTLARYDPAEGDWVPIPTKVDAANNRLTALVDDFSILQIMLSEQSPSVGETKAYPNPLRPHLSGHDHMNFDNLTAGSQLKIYTLRGELVREIPEDGAGMARWDGRNANGESVASGVFFVRIEGTNGDKILKVVVQR